MEKISIEFKFKFEAEESKLAGRKNMNEILYFLRIVILEIKRWKSCGSYLPMR